jgi:hypothetical protein
MPLNIDTSQLTANQVANLNAQQTMNDNQSANSMALLNMQRQEAQRSEAIAALSTVMKNAHDSSMQVINNSKG